MEQLVATGGSQYAYVGITTEDLTPTLARAVRLPGAHAARSIDTVRPGTPGARAGLRGGTREVDVQRRHFPTGGDVIVAIDGRPVRCADDVVRVVAERLTPGQAATFRSSVAASGCRCPCASASAASDPDAGRQKRATSTAEG